jgi:hypothetical protein
MGRPNAFDGMMDEFCLGLGFCGCVKDGKPLHVTDFIPETGPFLRANSQDGSLWRTVSIPTNLALQRSDDAGYPS